MIQMKLYDASLSEYIMIGGTPIGSEGHSGRHAVGFWDTVIDGEMWHYGARQPNPDGVSANARQDPEPTPGPGRAGRGIARAVRCRRARAR